MDDKILKNAQYRKGLSIAFFNATNAAIKLVSNSELLKSLKFVENQDLIMQLVKNYRNAFLEEHKKYYAEVIAQVGINYNAKESIEKLKDAKSYEELQTIWRLLSEDERHDGDIIKVAKELKVKFKKTND